MINKQLSKEFYLDVLSEMDPGDVYYELGVSAELPMNEVDWDKIIDAFFEMRWEQMDDSDKESYTADALQFCDENGILVGV